MTDAVPAPAPPSGWHRHPAPAAWLAATVALLLFFSPLVLADAPYQDDYIRSLLGQLFWTNVGRQGALWTTRILTLSDGVDPYPLTLVGAAAAMGGALVVAARLARGSPEPDFMVAAGAAFTSPFLLQNMSYRFDCLSMGIAASCAVVAASLAIATPRGTLPLRAALLVGMLFCYPPALGLYAGFALVLLSDRLLRAGPAARLLPELARTARAFVLPAALCFCYVLAFPHLATGDAERGTLSAASAGRNLRALERDTHVLLGGAQWIVAGRAAAAAAALPAVRRTVPVPVAVSVLLAAGAAWAACLGPNLLLRAPPPGVRVLMGFQTPLAIVLLLLGRLEQRFFAAGAAVLLVWNVSFCCRYGNFLSTMTRANDMVLSHLAYDLGRLRAERGVQRVEILDALPPSPVMRTMLFRMPSLGLVAQEGEMRWFAELRLAALTDGVALGRSCPLAAAALRRGSAAFTERAGDYVIRVYGPDAVVEFPALSTTDDGCP